MPDCKKNSNRMVKPSNPMNQMPMQAVPDAQQAPKRVLVTAGGRRLGAEICRQFAQAGWEVLCHFHTSGQEAVSLCGALHSEFGIKATPVQADLSRQDSRFEMVQQIQRQHGPVQALVNNAALFMPDMHADWGDAQALAHLQLNLLVPLALSREVFAHGVPQAGVPKPCVVHVLDQKVFNLNPDYFSYTLSKLALERAVSLQAQAMAPTVRVCGVAPGLMYLSGDQTSDNFALASRANLLRQAIDPADVAKACVFLAETESITGATLSVDNGQHLVPTPRDIMFVADDFLHAQSSASPPKGAAPTAPQPGESS